MSSSPSPSPKAPGLSYLGRNPSPQAFAKYAKKHDIFLHPDVAFLVPTKTMGMGVFAARPLPAGTVVISCPEASGVSPYMKALPTSPCVAVLHASESAMRDAVLFDVLVLLSELCRPQSPWRPWLETCPSMDHHLFDLTNAQTSVLGVAPTATVTLKDGNATQGSAPMKDLHKEGNSRLDLAAVTGVAQALQELQVAKRWAKAQAIIAAAPNLWPAEKATLALFCDCLAQVCSRNFHREELTGREGPYLLPGLDILNHSFAANTTFEVRGGGRKHATAFTVVTSRSVQRGEQIYGCYGRIGAARVAVEFQFATKAVLRNDLVRCAAASLASLATLLHYMTSASTVLDLTQMASVVEQHLSLADEAASALGANTTIAGEWTQELFGADSPAEVEAYYKEMQRRVEQLQRMGLLFDEGLYLVRPYATWEAEEKAEGVESFRWSSDAEHSKEIASHARLLAASVHLLTAAKADYEAIYHRISVDWEPSLTPQLRCTLRQFLQLKVVAAQRQLAAVKSTFGESARDTARRQLVEEVLLSEVSTLNYYAEAFA